MLKNMYNIGFVSICVIDLRVIILLVYIWHFPLTKGVQQLPLLYEMWHKEHLAHIHLSQKFGHEL